MPEPTQTIAAGWQAPVNIVAFTTTRAGGVSEAPYDSFNLGLHVGDDEDHVQRNRALLKEKFKLPNDPAWLQQTHSTRVLSLESRPAHTQPADGAVTSQAGLVCAVMTADCMPLFLCNNAGTKVGVVHAGWRGLAAGIIEQGVTALGEPAEQIIAWAGPTISAAHFEIGNEVRVQLGGSQQAYSPSSNPGRCYVDLYQLAGERLKAIGVSRYGHSQHCTYANAGLFYSHRRQQPTGRMVSLIYRS